MGFRLGYTLLAFALMWYFWQDPPQTFGLWFAFGVVHVVVGGLVYFVWKFRL